MNPGESFRTAYRGVAPGTRLNGIYEIDRMIGAGGMGEVYKCHEIQTGATVAIKMLLPEMAENEAALALFKREAAALHHLLHDAIVRYFLFSVEPSLQRPYLAMEFIDGRSLSDVLADGPLTFEALVRLMRRIASGLHAAHERGIIHRDVSPDNIIVPLGDVTRAKIIDFGIARSTRLDDKTIIGSGFAGKDNYVSPEQVGLYGGEVTAKSDIYSLGLLLFQALTGRKLDMGGSQLQLVEKRRRVPDLGGIDLRIRPLLERMLQPDPAHRPATMAEIADWRGAARPPALGRLERTEISVRRPEWAKAAAPRRRSIWWGVAASILVAVTGAAAYSFHALVWSAPVLVKPPPLPAFGEKSQADLQQPKPSLPVLRPTAPVPPAGDTAARTDRIRRYVEQYDGGECFLALPVAISASAAVIEGFGASIPAFETLDRSFRRDFGFEASIGVRLVTPAQCPAIRFLGQLGSNMARAPRINLDSVEVRNGEALSGSIENFANRVVELLLVSDGGEVQNLSYLLKPGTDSLSFSIGIRRSGGGDSPQLVMAVATPQVLDSLRQPRPMAADTFFLQAISEARRNNVTMATSARYFRIKNENQ
ncbi:MAG: serine/threonine protein kinase [Bradyrhizobium sp.]|uniref:serine/threonine-protein kinase n=1 Tax=Bradyrhizobium sp. TaxID=376 RepID=UPI001DD1AF4A|nr:serine/threonine-protein kinase [Bradyrhizobium sp.]MBV9561784.1 serine/threonine protein kinase [Bradyrhizobium sp.]